MDMLDQALDSSSQDKNESNGSDDNPQIHEDDGSVEESVDDPVVDGTTAGLLESGSVQYPFRAENGAVTFRVVQVTGGSGDGSEATQVISASSFAGQQGVPAVIASPFSNGNSPTGEGQAAEARFTYFPAVAATTDGTEGAATAAALATTPAGQFYVMMSPQDVLGGQRTIAPRSHQYNQKVDGPRTVRDERRRATHNEVERRRRDKINNWIIKLSKIVPDCAQDHAKQGQLITGSGSSSSSCPMPAQSKGGILAKTCDYINELRTTNQRLAESLKESERLSIDFELLRQQCDELKGENALLRAQLQQHGIGIGDLNTSSS